MKAANHEITTSPNVRAQVKDATGQDYDGSVKVRHFVEILLEDIGVPKLRKQFKQSLKGLKVASYYGCLLVRPQEVTKFDDPENPTSLDLLVTAMGGESLEWPYKVDCCGGGLNLTRTDVLAKLGGSIIEAAKSSGADCIAVACPMCQSSLDLRQKDIEKAAGKQFNMPVIYVSQLLGLCLGIPAKELGMSRLMVSPSAVTGKIRAAV
jgi:heterodisulfide reductase subunit B